MKVVVWDIAIKLEAVWPEIENLEFEFFVDQGDIESFLNENSSIHFLLVPIDKNHNKKIDKAIITFRDVYPEVNIIGITEGMSSSNVKRHQTGSSGANSYIGLEEIERGLWDMISSFMGEELISEESVEDEAFESLEEESGGMPSLSANRLETSLVAKLDQYGFNEEVILEHLQTLPESLAIQKLFDIIFKKNVPKFLSANALVQDDMNFDGDGLFLSSDSSLNLKLSTESKIELNHAKNVNTKSESKTKAENVVGEDDMASDKELDLGSDDSLDLDLSADEGKETEAGDMSFSSDLSLSDDQGDDLALSEGEMTSLSVDDSLDLRDGDVSSDDSKTKISPLPTPDINTSLEEELDFGVESDNDLSSSASSEKQIDLSDDAIKKLQEIEEYMTNSNLIRPLELNAVQEEEESLVEDMHGGDLNFSIEDDLSSPVDITSHDELEISDDIPDSGDEGVEMSFEVENEVVEVPLVVKSQASKAALAGATRADSITASSHHTLSGLQQEDYQAVVGGYSAELERLKATLNNLRSDRQDLLKKIEVYEDDKVARERQTLTMRAELDEKKIEVSLLKKKTSEENTELKFQLKISEEKRSLVEEKFKAMQQDLLELQQKSKMDVKRVSTRERELEQKLELLKVDAENQIRSRELKILELKRKLDTMEFDMENMVSFEKKNIESKQDLEQKLDKAIKTLRSTIGLLENEDPKLASLEKIKKNLDV